VDAIRDCGRAGTVRVLSHDAGTEIRQYLKEGAVDFTIDQNLGYQSYQTLDILYKLVVEYKKPEAEFFYSRSSILNAVMV
jgi:ABC-type sugar transport system substrate-binding protein